MELPPSLEIFPPITTLSKPTAVAPSVVILGKQKEDCGGPKQPFDIKTAPFDQNVNGITSANSSANSTFPGVAISHLMSELPVAKTRNLKLNISPLILTGVRLNHAALN
jgi:hypothetical protein